MHPVFISYNSQDAEQAVPLAEALKARDLDPWLDRWHLPPGEPWLQTLTRGLDQSDSVAVLIGPHGLGPVQQDEMAVTLDQARRQGKRVIPVLLPNAAPMPSFLAIYGAVELSEGPQGEGFDRLIWGITEKRPQPPRPTQVVPAPREYRLRVQRLSDGFEARWDDGTPFPLALPLTKAELDELSWYLERYLEFPGAGDHARAQALERRLDDWGRQLWQALFPGGADHRVYADMQAHLDRGGRVLLSLDSDSPEVLIRPWEMLRDAKGPLALRGLTLRRRLGAGTSTPGTGGFELALPLRVLLIVSRPSDTGFIDPRTSTRPVLDALAPLGGRVEVDFCEPPTLPELERRLSDARRNRKPYHIVHFDGHGQYYPETGVGALCFEDPARETELIAGRRLGDLLSRLRVPLVLLEACRGAQLSERPIFGAVAPALLQSGVGSVVAFSHSVHVAAATLLVARFYQALVVGSAVGEALEEARNALHADRRRWLTPGPDPDTVELQDWVIPQLYQRGGDPVLVPGGSDSDGKAKAEAIDDAVDDHSLPGFPPPPRYRFHGRARELLDLERAFHQHPAVLLHAGGGMGKTALAREAAHWWRRIGRFDQAVFQSFEQGAGAEQVVQAIGAALGDDGFAALGGDEQWAEAVRLFRRSPVLLVWDNFESVLPAFADAAGPDAANGTTGDTGGDAGGDGGGDAGLDDALDAPARAELQRLYRELTDGSPSGRLLVTCRPRETGLDGIREHPLQGLTRPDALHLLRGVVERKAIDLERDDYRREHIEALLDRLEDHPLSIELVAPHLQQLTPDAIAEQLAERLSQFEDTSHREGRNRSLLASLDFSRSRLSPAARDALPWLGWFGGGVFEAFFLAFSRIPETDWAELRTELTATALLRVETLEQFNTPYLKLHPTLAEAARTDREQADEETAGRFVEVYLRVMATADDLLGGSEPAVGMALVGREQANLRRAMRLAFRDGRHTQGWQLADTLRDYLQRAGRLRERDRLSTWVHDQMPDERLDGAACEALRQHAWTLFTQGQAQQALERVQDLERRLQAGELQQGDPDLQLALTRIYRGRILSNAGRPDLAIEPLQRAIEALRRLGDPQRGNLSAALGNLANALRDLGRFDAALETAEQGLVLARELGRGREVATGLGQVARILMASGRHREAEARYEEALEAAVAAGDLGLQGGLLQHMGGLQDEMGRPATAADRYREALRRFQQAGDRGNEMRTCDLLGSAERRLDHLDAAEAWYRKALDLAEALGDRRQTGRTRHNLGILFQIRGELSEEPAERRQWLNRAAAEVEASLATNQAMQDRLGEASSRSQLGVLHRLLGDLDRADTEARQALAIRESLNQPDVWKVYANLAEIARARGDQQAADQWQAKADAKQEALARLAAGPDQADDAVPEQLTQALIQLAQAVHQARGQGRKPPPDLAEALAQVAGLPEPLAGLGRFLQAVADGERPPPPPDLPPPLDQIAPALLEALA